MGVSTPTGHKLSLPMLMTQVDSRHKQEEEDVGSGNCDGEMEDSFPSFLPDGGVLKEAEMIIPVSYWIGIGGRLICQNPIKYLILFETCLNNFNCLRIRKGKGVWNQNISQIMCLRLLGKLHNSLSSRFMREL